MAIKQLKSRTKLTDEIIEYCTNNPFNSYVLEILNYHYNDNNPPRYVNDFLSLIDNDNIKIYMRGFFACNFAEIEDFHELIENTSLKEIISPYEFKTRDLYIGERVYVYNGAKDYENCFGTIIAINGESKSLTNIQDICADNISVTVLFDTKTTDGVIETYNMNNVYTLTKNNIKCPNCGNESYNEIDNDIDGQYYCPHCETHFY